MDRGRTQRRAPHVPPKGDREPRNKQIEEHEDRDPKGEQDEFCIRQRASRGAPGPSSGAPPPRLGGPQERDLDVAERDGVPEAQRFPCDGQAIAQRAVRAVEIAHRNWPAPSTATWAWYRDTLRLSSTTSLSRPRPRRISGPVMSTLLTCASSSRTSNLATAAGPEWDGRPSSSDAKVPNTAV